MATDYQMRSESIDAALMETGSEEFKADLAAVMTTLRPYRDFTVAEAVARIGRVTPVKGRDDMLLIRPCDHAPGSRDVDWALIRQNLPQ